MNYDESLQLEIDEIGAEIKRDEESRQRFHLSRRAQWRRQKHFQKSRRFSYSDAETVRLIVEILVGL